MLPSAFHLCLLINLSACTVNKTFPTWFKFGSGTSAFQVEGAWNVSDKSESRLDRLIHSNPNFVGDLSNSDVTCDSYHQWKRDIEMVSELGLQFYRFSISWTRLLPNGFANIISEDGKQYYNNLINGLLEKGIEPFVTIYHFDLPQIFQDLGGWTNPSMPDWFEDYTRVVFTLFGDRVKYFITINEPQMDCDLFYATRMPGLMYMEHNVAAYLCGKYMLMAHAKAWRLYDQEFRPRFKGKISLTNHLLWFTPYSPEDDTLTETTREFYVGRYSHPVFSNKGGWPPILVEVIANTSKRLGYKRSRLPSFTPEEIELLKGTYDFYGMNHYTSRLVRPRLPWEKVDDDMLLTSVPDINAVFDMDPKWPFGFSPLMPINPIGMREQLQWLRKHYGDLEIMIIENGYSSKDSRLEDDDRIAFIKAHLEQILIAIDEGINVTAYSYWSLMDDFEFFDGFMSKFGLYKVDFADSNRKRTPRTSALYYKKLIKHRYLPSDSQ